MIHFYNGAYAVTRDGQVTTSLCSIGRLGSPWRWMAKVGERTHRWTVRGKWSTMRIAEDHPLDIIFTSHNKHEAIAFAQSYLDRLDKPNRRGRPTQEWLANEDKTWGDWELDNSSWNTSTHDIQFECIGGIHRIRRRERKDLLPKTFWLYGNDPRDLDASSEKPSRSWPICFEVERKE